MQNAEQRMAEDKAFLRRAVAMHWIGTTEDKYEYLHPDGHRYMGRFSFYWNMNNGQIDVNHSGCNGSIFRGSLSEDGEVKFYGIPPAYPNEQIFKEEFLKLQKEFLEKFSEPS